MPLPPVTPVNSPITPPGSYYASGIVSTSGATAGTYQGPWFVEEQGMDISYHRVPYGSLSSFDLRLSGATVTEKVNGTMLVCEITAYYTSHKDWNFYNTSTWSQAQKFEFVNFSADSYGHTYGALTASTLGPMGSIITKQPYYNRRLWSDLSGDASASKQITGANYYAARVYRGQCPEVSSTIDQTRFNDKYEYWWINSQLEGTLLDSWDVEVDSPGARSYCIPGVYSTTQENIWQIFKLIDRLGYDVQTTFLYSIPATISSHAFVLDQGIPEYRNSRHDYT